MTLSWHKPDNQHTGKPSYGAEGEHREGLEVRRGESHGVQQLLPCKAATGNWEPLRQLLHFHLVVFEDELRSERPWSFLVMEL